MKAAIYSRFSTERQSEASIADQERVCGEYAQRKGWTIIERYSDAHISGGAMGNRPGFLRMRADAMAGRFELLLVTDTTRLCRSGVLQPLIERLRYQGVRVIGVQDSFDSSTGFSDLQASMSGAMSIEFRRMIKARTHAALESRARAGRSAGGRAYGYRDGAVDEAESKVVREIFERFRDGASCRTIAAELNGRGVPSPGSAWKRTSRRACGWMSNGIRVIVRNERYRGIVHWNTSEWRKDPDSGKRLRVARPRSEWITRTDEAQRIISDQLWQAAKARFERRRREVGDAVKRGCRRGTGRVPKYLFSGILRCKLCGSSYVQAGATHYSCSGHVNGLACENGQRFRRDVMEHKLLEALRTELLSEESIAEYKARLVKRLRRPAVDARKVRKLEAEITNLVQGVAEGIRSPALMARLGATEAELEQLKAAAQVVDVKALTAALDCAVEEYMEWVADLGNAPIDVPRGRAIIERIAPRIPVRPGPDGVPIAEVSLQEAVPLALAAGSDIGGIPRPRYHKNLRAPDSLLQLLQVQADTATKCLPDACGTNLDDLAVDTLLCQALKLALGCSESSGECLGTAQCAARDRIREVRDFSAQLGDALVICRALRAPGDRASVAALDLLCDLIRQQVVLDPLEQSVLHHGELRGESVAAGVRAALFVRGTAVGLPPPLPTDDHHAAAADAALEQARKEIRRLASGPVPGALDAFADIRPCLRRGVVPRAHALVQFLIDDAKLGHHVANPLRLRTLHDPALAGVGIFLPARRIPDVLAAIEWILKDHLHAASEPPRDTPHLAAAPRAAGRRHTPPVQLIRER